MQLELAQLNIATLVAPLDSPVLADFVADLDRINGLADKSPGFVWRLQSEGGNATDVEHDFGDNVIANMSVWTSVEDLHNYIYKTAHAQVMSRRIMMCVPLFHVREIITLPTRAKGTIYRLESSGRDGYNRPQADIGMIAMITGLQGNC